MMFSLEVNLCAVIELVTLIYMIIRDFIKK